MKKKKRIISQIVRVQVLHRDDPNIQTPKIFPENFKRFLLVIELKGIGVS